MRSSSLMQTSIYLCIHMEETSQTNENSHMHTEIEDVSLSLTYTKCIASFGLYFMYVINMVSNLLNLLTNSHLWSYFEQMIS